MYYRKKPIFLRTWLKKKGERLIQADIDELIAMVESRSSMPRDRVLYALELAIEQAVCEYFKTQECLVEIEDRIVNPIFYSSSGSKTDKTDKTLVHWVDGGLNGPEITFGMLSKNIIKRCRKLFSRNLSLM